MNRVIKVKGEEYVLRQQTNKLELFKVGTQKIICKVHIEVSFCYVNEESMEILAICHRKITVLAVSGAPIELTVTHECFVDWEAKCGIILREFIILYDGHSIIIYTRGLSKHCSIDILQEIVEVKTNPEETMIAMRASEPECTLLLWQIHDLRIESHQDVTCNAGILAFEFLSHGCLALLAPYEFRLFCQDSSSHYTLHHFYSIPLYINFCFVGPFCIATHPRLSINHVLFLASNATASFYALYSADTLARNSPIELLKSLPLTPNGVKIYAVLSACESKSTKTMVLLCETKRKALFCITLTADLRIDLVEAFEPSIGVNIARLVCDHGLIAVKDKHGCKLFEENDEWCLVRVLPDYEKIFICKKGLYLLKEGKLRFERKQVQDKEIEGLETQLKYTRPEQVEKIEETDDTLYLLNGIRYLRVDSLSVVNCGFAIRNDKVLLQEVVSHTHSILYKLHDQFILLDYRLSHDKIHTTTLKTSLHRCLSLGDGRWLEIRPHEFTVGEEQKILCVFNLSSLYEVLDADNKYDEYQLHVLTEGALMLIIQNYAFFLQIVENESGSEVVILRRNGKVLHERCKVGKKMSLINAKEVILWSGEKVMRMKSKIGSDPYGLPETLLKDQLASRSSYPPYHPEVLLNLLELAQVGSAVRVLIKVAEWRRNSVRVISDLYASITPELLSLDAPELPFDFQSSLSLLNELFAEVKNDSVLRQHENSYKQIIGAILFFIENQNGLDYFSTGAVLLTKCCGEQGRVLTSMNVAHLLQSGNKEEAAAYLRGEETATWAWMQRCSVPLWYHNQEQLRKWVEEVAADEFRRRKDPFDCLFWYILAGKKSLLLTLFRSQKFQSKEHTAMCAFLERDFSEAIHRSAAVKNAYVLIDKKRYLHAVSFFALGGQWQECFNTCVERLHDINLAFLLSVYYPLGEAVRNYLDKEGDLWMRHVSAVHSATHLVSFQLLSTPFIKDKWSHSPPLVGYHPSLLPFTRHLAKSFKVRRELLSSLPPEHLTSSLQLQEPTSLFPPEQPTSLFPLEQPLSLFPPEQPTFLLPPEQPTSLFPLEQPTLLPTINNQSYSSFSHSTFVHETLMNEQFNELIIDEHKVRTHGCRYYLRKGLPLVALWIDHQNKAAIESQQLQRYINLGEIYPSVKNVIEKLEDTVGIIKSYLQDKKMNSLVEFMVGYKRKFEKVLKEFPLEETLRVWKQEIGMLMHMSFESDKIMNCVEECEDKGVKEIFKELYLLSALGKIYIELGCGTIISIENNLRILMDPTYCWKASAEFWSSLVKYYSSLPDHPKHKPLRLMDELEHTFVTPPAKESAVEPCLAFTDKQRCFTFFKMHLFRFLTHNVPFFPYFKLTQIALVKVFREWLTPHQQNSFKQELHLLLQDKNPFQLKFPHFGSVFGDCFEQFVAVLRLIKKEHIFQEKISISNENYSKEEKEISCLEIFKFKQDTIHKMILNKNAGKGLECALLFSKTIKKVEVCKMLNDKEKTKGGGGKENESEYEMKDDLEIRIDTESEINAALRHIYRCKQAIKGSGYLNKSIERKSDPFYKQSDLGIYNVEEIYSMQAHDYYPFVLLGGRGYVEVCEFATLRNFNRIKCPGQNEIIKTVSCAQRVSCLDAQGILCSYHFDAKYQNNCLYALKKTPVQDFCHVGPSILAVLDKTGILLHDTLLPPSKAVTFKVTLANTPLCIESLGRNRLALLRKNEILLYDTRMDKLYDTKDLKGKAKCIHFNAERIYVGQTDSKVHTIELQSDVTFEYAVGSFLNEDKKPSIEEICSFDSVVLCRNSDNSLFYLPPYEP